MHGARRQRRHAECRRPSWPAAHKWPRHFVRSQWRCSPLGYGGSMHTSHPPAQCRMAETRVDSTTPPCRSLQWQPVQHQPLSQGGSHGHALRESDINKELRLVSSIVQLSRKAAAVGDSHPSEHSRPSVKLCHVRVAGTAILTDQVVHLSSRSTRGTCIDRRARVR